MTRTVTIVAVCLWAAGSSLTAQTIQAGNLTVKLGGRMQEQFSTTSVDEADLIAIGRAPTVAIPTTMFEMRRLRLAAELAYGAPISGKIELEFAMARLQSREAWMNVGVDPALQFRFGQLKKPFSLLQLTSSTRWPIIERAVRIRGLQEDLLAFDRDSTFRSFQGTAVIPEEQNILDLFSYQNFDLGAAVLGNAGPVGYMAGVFNGPGSDRVDDTDGKSIAGRATVRLPVEAPFILGAGVSTREFRVRTTPSILTRSGTAFEVDLEYGEFRRPGLHIMAEGATGTNLAVDETFTAGQFIAAWFQPTAGRIEGWEIAGRIGYGDSNRDRFDDEALFLTPGFNIYFTGRNRLMLNWDVFLPSGDLFNDANAIRAQAQIYF